MGQKCLYTATFIPYHHVRTVTISARKHLQFLTLRGAFVNGMILVKQNLTKLVKVLFMHPVPNRCVQRHNLSRRDLRLASRFADAFG